MKDLETRLLAAHAAGDLAALVTLYTEAADRAPAPQAQAFFLTHAYVYALDCGADQAPKLRARLERLGAEPSQA